MQDFPDGGVNPIGGGANLLYGQMFLQNCMKMKEKLSKPPRKSFLHKKSYR